MKKFTFTFTGERAEEVAERFSAYFWDGGLDQYIEQEFLADFGLGLDDVEMDDNGGAIVKTDGGA